MLALLWERIPAMWVTHWGADGRPDGWARRSVFGVFFPIGLGVAVWAVNEAIAWWMRWRAENARAGKRAPVEVVEATSDFLRIMGAALATLFAMLAVVMPLAPPRSPVVVVVAAAALVGGALILGMARLRRAVRAARERDPRALEGWTGLTYRNPKDPRIWVPKLLGMGYTLNFAHRRAWLILAALLAVPLAVVVAVLVAALR